MFDECSQKEYFEHEGRQVVVKEKGSLYKEERQEVEQKPTKQHFTVLYKPVPFIYKNKNASKF